MRVADATVIQVRDLVEGVVGEFRGGRRLAIGLGERDVPGGIGGGPGFDLVDARLRPAVGGLDGDADGVRQGRPETLDIAPDVDGGPRGGLAVGVGFGLAGVDEAIDFGELSGDAAGLESRVGRGGEGDLALGVLDAREDGLEAVIVLLGDRVELVVVAAGAGDGQAEEGGAGRRDHVVEVVDALLAHPLDGGVADLVVRPRDEEPGGRAASSQSASGSSAGRVSPASCSRAKRGRGCRG